MKKIIFLCATVIFSTGIFASPISVPDKSEKILKLFHHDFPEIANPKIYTVGNTYMIYFKNEKDNSSCRIFYDSNGAVIETYKYYSCAELTPFIRAKINSKYEGMKITGVTEVINPSEHYYHVSLEGSHSLFMINVDATGNINLEKKFDKD